MAEKSGTTQVWERVLERKQGDLAALLRVLSRKSKRHNVLSMPLITLEEAIRLQEFDNFKASLDRLCTEFAAKGTSKILIKYLYPHLDHVRSFNHAISSATSGEVAASLTWGVLLIVVQCGCIFVESLDEIMQQLEELQKLLPDFQKDMELYPTSMTLMFLLQDIYTDYVDYCIIIVRNLTRPPLVNFVRGIISSSLRRDLKKMKVKIGNDVNSFERAVERAERYRSKNADDRNQASRATNNPNPPKFPIHSVHMGENHDFVGRENELDTLYDTLVKLHTDAKPRSCVIHGIGGVGKSQFALKFIYKYKSAFQAVFWISADPEKGTEGLRTFGVIGRKLHLFDTEDMDQSKVEMIIDWLETAEQRWLLVFDNVVDWASVSRYWPTRSAAPSAIIVTSQKAATWTDHQLLLEPFDALGGSELLLSQLHLSQIDRLDPRRKLAAEVSEELGGSPLYLCHAQGSMALSKSSLEEFLETIRTSSNTLNMKSSNIWRYGRAISATHDRILKELSHEATDLLFMLAFMSADYMSEDLLLCEQENIDIAFLNDKPAYLGCIAELADSQLVRRERDGDRMYLSIHRATQKAMLHKLNNEPDLRETAFRRVVGLIREKLPSPSKLQIAEARVWPLIERVLPHVQSVVLAFERARPAIAGSLDFAELLADVGGMDLYDRGRIHEAYKLSRKTITILDDLGAPLETPLRGDALTIIGLCTDVMGIEKRVEGVEVREECLKVRQRCYDMIPSGDITVDDRIRLHNSYMDLACSLQHFNDFERIEQHAERCLVQYKSWGDENRFPYEYAKYYNHMAYVLLYKGRTAKAVEFAKKGFELAETATPGTQLAVLNKFDWANLLFQHGDMQRSLEAHKEVLKVRKRECGEENVRTLESRLNIGIIQYFGGQLDQAEKQINRTLAVNDWALWPSENIARAKYYMSQVLKKRDPKNQQAVKLEQEAKNSVDQLLKHESLGKAAAYHGDYAILFDFMVPWECRLITPRKGRPLAASTTLATDDRAVTNRILDIDNPAPSNFIDLCHGESEHIMLESPCSFHGAFNA